ncbi:MAG: glutamine--fructose-6-phosphate transaminase (isomerizing) [Desulfatiglandaceae bacterium]
MCGIVCYVGTRDACPLLLEGLKHLEYRGYDSAGVAVQNQDGVFCRKMVGKIAVLEADLNGSMPGGSTGIAHTRWATHGEPSEVNAHPQMDGPGDVFVIHNGIIENYLSHRKRLEKNGVVFRSDTDTEVIAHLVSKNFDGDLTGAVRKTMSQLEGTFGIAVLHRLCPEEIVVARRGSPLIIGLGEDGHFAASDVSAMLRYTDKVVHLQDNELAILKKNDFSISTAQAKTIKRSSETVEWHAEDIGLNGFPHFMLKEIFEQPETINNAIRGRIEPGDGVPKLGGLVPVWESLKECRHMVLIGCGTSYYAALAGRYVFEKLTDIDLQVELASEFRYRKLNFQANTFVVGLSQSGETADTLAAIREAKRKGARLLGIVNVVGSSISRETEAGVYNHAGPEIGVASTKMFTSQLVVLTLMALLLGRHQHLSVTEGVEAIRALQALSEKVEDVLSCSALIESIARKYYCFDNWLFLGRKYNFPVAMEGALKLKEISYIHAEGYAAGEMKHGPIALINSRMPTVAIAPRDDMYEKMIGNIHEIKSRKGSVIAIATKGDARIREVADEVIEIPETLDFLNPVLAAVPCQLLAYYCALLLGRDIDKPRNLAKSVTVE